MATQPTAPAARPTPAQAAHPLNRPQTAPPATPQPPRPSQPIKIARGLKIVAVSVVIIAFIGLLASLGHHSSEIADLKTKIQSTSNQTLMNEKLDYAIKLCDKVAAAGDGPECIQETLDSLH